MERVEGHGQAVVVLVEAEHGVLGLGQEPRLVARGAQPQRHVHDPAVDVGHDVDHARAPGHHHLRVDDAHGPAGSHARAHPARRAA